MSPLPFYFSTPYGPYGESDTETETEESDNESD